MVNQLKARIEELKKEDGIISREILRLKDVKTNVETAIQVLTEEIQKAEKPVLPETEQPKPIAPKKK